MFVFQFAGDEIFGINGRCTDRTGSISTNTKIWLERKMTRPASNISYIGIKVFGEMARIDPGETTVRTVYQKSHDS
jgi:hypothetical protein